MTRQKCKRRYCWYFCFSVLLVGYSKNIVEKIANEFVCVIKWTSEIREYFHIRIWTEHKLNYSSSFTITIVYHLITV